MGKLDKGKAQNCKNGSVFIIFSGLTRRQLLPHERETHP